VVFMYAGLCLGARLLLGRRSQKKKSDSAIITAQQHDHHRQYATVLGIFLYGVLSLQSFYEAAVVSLT